MVVVFCLLLLAAGCIVLYNQKEHQRETERKDKMHRDSFYQRLHSFRYAASTIAIDRLLIEPNRITLFGVEPAGKIQEFILSEHGCRPLTNERQLALMSLLEDDIPLLGSKSHYSLSRIPIVLSDGKHAYCYQYTIRSAYKTSLYYQKQRSKAVY